MVSGIATHEVEAIHDVEANKHLPHPRSLDSEDLILRHECLS